MMNPGPDVVPVLVAFLLTVVMFGVTFLVFHWEGDDEV